MFYKCTTSVLLPPFRNIRRFRFAGKLRSRTKYFGLSRFTLPHSRRRACLARTPLAHASRTRPLALPLPLALRRRRRRRRPPPLPVAPRLPTAPRRLPHCSLSPPPHHFLSNSSHPACAMNLLGQRLGFYRRRRASRRRRRSIYMRQRWIRVLQCWIWCRALPLLHPAHPPPPHSKHSRARPRSRWQRS